MIYFYSYLIDSSEDPIHSQSLFGLKGEAWKEKRTEITPVLTRIQNLYPKIHEITQNFIKSFQKEEKALEVKELSKKLFSEITLKAIYGTSCENFQNLVDGMSINVDLITLIKMFLLTSFPSLKNYLKIQFSKLEDHNSFRNLIQKSVENRQNSNEVFLDYLIYLKSIKKDFDLTSHALPFLSHGIEMSSIALSCTLYEVRKINYRNHYIKHFFQNSLLKINEFKRNCEKKLSETRMKMEKFLLKISNKCFILIKFYTKH